MDVARTRVMSVIVATGTAVTVTTMAVIATNAIWLGFASSYRTTLTTKVSRGGTAA